MNGGETAQMKLELPVGLTSLYGFAWPETPRWDILNGKEVLVPIIDGPLNVRRCADEYSCLLKAGNTSVVVLERMIKGLFDKGIPFIKETCPTVFDDSITIEIFTPSPINIEKQGDVHGKGRLVVMSNAVSYIGSDFPLIVITLGRTPNIVGWVWVKQPRFKAV
jgi:hypothetical protein